MFKSFSMDLAGRTLTVEVGRVAKQANGAAFMHYGDTVVLSTATASEKPRDGIDFFPLSVEYEEKLYAVGKIPGGFTKREGKASENAILTARVIDRPMRPLFPKDYRNDVTLDNIVMSVDPDCSPELTAMLGSAIATSISDIPFDGPCATTQVGLIDGEFVINPTSAQKQVSDLALTVASTREKVIRYSNRHMDRLLDMVGKASFNWKIGFDSCTVPALIYQPGNIDLNSIDTCEGARWSAYISSDMKMMPCSFDNQRQKWAVDLRKFSISEAWKSRQFDNFRNRLRDACPGCSRQSICLGGCPICPEIVLCERKSSQERNC